MAFESLEFQINRILTSWRELDFNDYESLNLLIEIHILLQISVYNCTEVLFFSFSQYGLKSQSSAFLQNTVLCLIYFQFSLTSQNLHKIKLPKLKGSMCVI